MNISWGFNNPVNWVICAVASISFLIGYYYGVRVKLNMVGSNNDKDKLKKEKTRLSEM